MALEIQFWKAPDVDAKPGRVTVGIMFDVSFKITGINPARLTNLVGIGSEVDLFFCCLSTEYMNTLTFPQTISYIGRIFDG